MKKILSAWRKTIVLILIILGLAFFLRVYNLVILPVFADEAIYIRWAQVMRAESTLRFLPLSDGKQPLFMWLVIPFLKVFDDPLFAGRFTSLVSGIAATVGVFLLAYYLFKSKNVALIASLIYAVSPFSVFFDRMALVDSLLTTFGVWTLVFAILTSRTLRLDFAMLTGFALGGALLTKSPGLFFVILLPSVWILTELPKGRMKRLTHLIKLVLLTSVSVAIAYGIYNVLRLGPNFHLIAARNQDYIFPISHIWTNPKDPFVFHFDRGVEWILTLGPSVVVLISILAFFVNLKKFLKELMLLSLWFILPISVQAEFAKTFTARYILFSLPYLFAIAASSFLAEQAALKKVLVIIFLVWIFQALRFDYLFLTDPQKANLPRSERSGYLEEWTSGYGIREVADYLRGQYKKDPQKKIVAGTEGYFGTLPDGLQIYLNDLPEISVIGVGLNFRQLPQSLVESKGAGNKTYLVVNNSRFDGDAGSLGLELVAAYPKALRIEGTKEYNVHGPQESLLFFQLK